jgi:NAD(P)-dependent dehydrogenase (short-subunit alcohol dehydrogenase family)
MRKPAFWGLSLAAAGAARGIGRAIAVGFAGSGANVALIDLDADGLHTSRELCEARGIVAQLYGERGRRRRRMPRHECGCPGLRTTRRAGQQRRHYAAACFLFLHRSAARFRARFGSSACRAESKFFQSRTSGSEHSAL